MNSYEPQPVSGVPDFWERARHASHRLLALDYDGTLAPFRIRREEAVPLPGVMEALTGIRNRGDTTLAILSGRPARDVLGFIGRSLHVAIIGSHGWEILHSDGTDEVMTPSHTQFQGITRAVILAVNAGYEDQLERKVAGVALHTRGLDNPGEIEENVRALWQPIAKQHDLTTMTFNRGVELRVSGHNKGTALAELHGAMPAGTLPVYIGDDSTDEDAFRYLQPLGIGIKVGTDGETAAAGRIPNPTAVLQFLRDWSQLP